MVVKHAEGPPLNAALLPDMYTRLDAATVEKTRVVNEQLDVRLKLQERTISRHKSDAMKIYNKERRRIRNDVHRMRLKDRKLFEPSEATSKIQLKGKKVGKFCERFFYHHLKLPSLIDHNRHSDPSRNREDNADNADIGLPVIEN